MTKTLSERREEEKRKKKVKKASRAIKKDTSGEWSWDSIREQITDLRGQVVNASGLVTTQLTVEQTAKATPEQIIEIEELLKVFLEEVKVVNKELDDLSSEISDYKGKAKTEGESTVIFLAHEELARIATIYAASIPPMVQRYSEIYSDLEGA